MKNFHNFVSQLSNFGKTLPLLKAQGFNGLLCLWLKQTVELCRGKLLDVCLLDLFSLIVCWVCLCSTQNLHMEIGCDRLPVTLLTSQ